MMFLSLFTDWNTESFCGGFTITQSEEDQNATEEGNEGCYGRRWCQ
jgi:hypothetical protein